MTKLGKILVCGLSNLRKVLRGNKIILKKTTGHKSLTCSSDKTDLNFRFQARTIKNFNFSYLFFTNKLNEAISDSSPTERFPVVVLPLAEVT